VHDAVREWFDAAPSDPYRRRANLAIQHLAAFGRTNIVKTVRGPNRGWRRAPLGGQGGYHFYLWWAPNDAPPVRGMNAPKGSILVRAARHHDATNEALPAGDIGRDYHPVEPLRLVFDDTMGAAYTADQTEYARLSHPMRQFRGHPGSGKTTTLWLSALWLEATEVLYLTRHRGLADSAREYLATFAPRGSTVRVETLDSLLAEILGRAHAPQGLNHHRERFRREPVYEDTGIWRGKPGLLYDELYAYAFGRALPFDFRGLRSEDVVVDPDTYAAARAPALGEDAAARAAMVIRTLGNRDADWSELFPQPVAARRALDVLNATGLPPSVANAGGIFVDEVQDLTPVEYALIMRVAALIGEETGTRPAVGVAGDEAQVVTPSAFDWGEFGELADRELSGPQDHVLPQNVRSPYAIAQVVNNTWDLYRSVSKSVRPTGYARARHEYHTVAHVMYANCETREEFARLVSHITDLPGSAAVYAGYEVPREYAAFREVVMLPEDIKGLERQTVAVLAPGEHILTVAGDGDEGVRGDGPEELWSKLLVDRLRVCLSRATEDLLLIDLQAGDEAAESVRKLCDGVEGFHEATAAEMEAFVTHHRYDAEELVQRYISDAHSLIQQDQWSAAARTARRAVDLLGDAEDPGSVTDASLRREAYAVVGETAFRWACALGLRSDDTPLLEEAGGAFDDAGDDASGEVVRLFAARVSADADEPPPDAMARLAVLRPETVPGLRPIVEAAISQWLGDVPPLDEAVPRATRMELVAALYTLATGPSGDIYADDDRVVDALRPAFGADVLAEILSARAAHRDVENLLSEEANARQRAEDQLATARADMDATRDALSREQDHSREVEEWYADSEATLETALTDKANERSLVSDIETELAKVSTAHTDLMAELGTIRTMRDEAISERDEHALRVATLEAEAEKLRERAARTDDEARKMLEERAARRKAEEALAQASALREDAEKRSRALEFEAERLRAEHADLAGSAERAADLDALLAMAEEEREAATQARSKADARVERMQTEVSSLTDRLEASQQENAALQELAEEAKAAREAAAAEEAEPPKRRGRWLGRSSLLLLSISLATSAAFAATHLSPRRRGRWHAVCGLLALERSAPDTAASAPYGAGAAAT